MIALRNAERYLPAAADGMILAGAGTSKSNAVALLCGSTVIVVL